MKKLFITALFAILMGGFAITANAQIKVVNDNDQKVETVKKPEAKNKKAKDKKVFGKDNKVQIDGVKKANADNDQKVETVKKPEAKNKKAKDKKVFGKDNKVQIDGVKKANAKDKTASINAKYGLALKEYETTVNACVAAHNEMMINKDEKAIKEFNKYLLQARSQRDELYKVYDQLSPAQQKKYNQISDEFAKVDTTK